MAEVTVNGDSRAVDEGTTLAQLLDGFDSGGSPVVAAVNGEHVPRAEHGKTLLEDGDSVEVLAVRQGG